MNELKNQFANALVVILTVAAVVAGFLNFQQNFDPEKRYKVPEDGVTWVDRKSGEENRVIALHIAPDSPGAKAGLKPNDQVLKIQGMPIETEIDVIQALGNVPIWQNAEYTINRSGIEFKSKVLVAERRPDYTVSYQYLIGLAYLGIGLFVYFRRGTAPKALHFLVLCMVSFVLSTFHHTSKLNPFDKIMYWGNIAANIYAPTIFLHFCLTFPRRTASRVRHPDAPIPR